MSNQPPPQPPPEVLAENRAAVLPLILEEVLRQRKEQDERLEYQRRVAGLFFSVLLPSAVLVTIWWPRLGFEFNNYLMVTSAVLFAYGMLAAIMVLIPREWQSGPKIQQLMSRPLNNGWDLQKFQYTLIITHLQEFKVNETRVRRVGWGLTATIILSLSSALCLVTSVVI